jgi:uncharacterized membrane protein YgcG
MRKFEYVKRTGAVQSCVTRVLENPKMFPSQKQKHYGFILKTTMAVTMIMMGRRSSFVSSVLWTLLACTTLFSSNNSRLWGAAAAEAEADDIIGSRVGNLDYMDAATVKYYLSAPKEDYNVAIMFYAQWCRNCHAFAPTWGQIGDHRSAGTEESKLILGLFDCETDYEHQEICSAAGVTHYPTLQYYSLAGQQFQRKVPKHTNVFAGNWQYGDAVLDWLTVNQALSQWHRAGWGKRLRQLLTGRKPGSGSAKLALPVGVPGTGTGSATLSSTSSGSASSGSASSGSASSGSASSGSAGAGAASSAAVKGLESKVAKLEQESKELQDVAGRSAVVVDCMLFPVSVEGPDAAKYMYVSDPAVTSSSDADAATTISSSETSYTDLYRYLDQTGGWTATADPEKEIVRTCVMEVGLDFCNRLLTHQAQAWISTFADSDDITDEDVDAFQARQMQQIAATEPYCAILEDCVVTEFADTAVCRPPACPFRDESVCRYLTACLTEQMQTEYAIAMGFLEAPGSSSSYGSGSAGSDPTSTAGTAASSAGVPPPETGGGGWGV